MSEQSAIEQQIDDGRAIEGAASPFPPEIGAGAVFAQAGCPTCGNSGVPAEQNALSTSYIYAIGRIEARFPNLAAEKEFAQAAGRSDTAGKTDHQTFHAVLSKRENRYLLRQLCWVLNIEGLDSYLLLPRDPLDFELLVQAIRPVANANDIDVVIGLRGPVAPPAMCNGLMAPILVFDQIYSFDRPTLVKAIPKPERMDEDQFGPAADELFTRIMQMTDNAGATDEHRALNYLAMRYPAIYARAAEQFALDFSMTGVEARPAPLSGARRMVDVIFSYTNRNTDFTEKFFVRVDASEEFPFLVKKLSPYYDRGVMA